MLLRKILSIFEHKLSTQKQVKMYYLNIPDIETQRVSFYLAVEEYAARFLKEDPIFFFWQVEPSVIIGRRMYVVK